MITPERKPESPPLHPNDRTVNQIHYKIKQPTTNPNTWYWSAWCFSDRGSFSSLESIGWRPCQQ